jgi:activating signal cointegrator complex subunit 1
VQAVSGFYQELASDGIDPRLCAKKEHLHITICMLKLYSNHQLQLAKNVLSKHSEAIRAAASNGPLLVTLAGLEIMNDDPSAVDVVYAKAGPDESMRRLHAVATVVVNALESAELLSEDEIDRQRLRRSDGSVSVKVHATLLNSRYKNADKNARSGARETFDATSLLRDRKDVPLGSGPIEGIHLSQRGKYQGNGYFFCESSVAFASHPKPKK